MPREFKFGCMHVSPHHISNLSIVPPAHAGSFQVERITVDVGLPISVPALDVGVPINVELEVPEVDLVLGLGNQTSLPESGEQNTFHIEGIAGPDPLSVPNGSNGIWHLRYITACNFVSNATVGVLYLGKKLQGCNDTYQVIIKSCFTCFFFWRPFILRKQKGSSPYFINRIGYIS